MKIRTAVSTMILTTVALLFGACAQKAPQEVADYTVKNSNETVKIEVSSSGYIPKSVAVKKGQPVKLQFVRKDSNNCGDEVVFPTMNLRKSLPVGEVVEIEITPDKVGEIKFACGMDMLRGKLIVSE